MTTRRNFLSRTIKAIAGCMVAPAGWAMLPAPAPGPSPFHRWHADLWSEGFERDDIPFDPVTEHTFTFYGEGLLDFDRHPFEVNEDDAQQLRDGAIVGG